MSLFISFVPVDTAQCMTFDLLSPVVHDKYVTFQFQNSHFRKAPNPSPFISQLHKMAGHVCFQVTSLGKHFPTHMTLVFPQPSVDVHMLT